MRGIIFTLGIFFMAVINLNAFAQREPDKDKIPEKMLKSVDTRIDNMGYWKKMAEKGLVPYTPVLPIKPAEYKGSLIDGKGLKLPDSPDIPVTSLSSVTESENSVFVDPDNNQYLLNSNNSTSWSGGSVGSLYGANYFQSSNGGSVWGGSYSGAGGANSGDPAAAISRSGRQYVNYISGAGGQGVAYADDGATWSTATIAPNPGDLADKNHMTIDNSLTSAYTGNLYCAWTDFGGTDDTQIKISRSVNNGAAWSTGVNISSAVAAGSHNQGVNVQTGPNGEVYVVWTIYDSWPSDETALGFAKSTNGGVSYSTASRIISNIRGIRTTGVLKNQRVNSFPVMAVDVSGGPNNGNIYIVWTNTGVPGTNTGTNKSVYMIRSTNGGTTWSTPIRVNQGTFTEGKESYFPWITCDPETGTLAIIFYDDRNTVSTACETWVAYSIDAGTTWTDFRVSDVSFTPTPISGLASSYMGDYLGITSKGGRVYPCWTDTRGGLFMTYVSPFVIGLNASFTSSITNVCAGSGVTFTDQSSGPPTSWTWSFPGGTPSSYVGQNPPAITYSTPGTYDVSLTVGDGTETNTMTKTGYITVKNIFADFTGTPTTVVIGNTVAFTDNSTCSPTSWNWSFPGGTPSSYIGQTPPAITYSTLGTYNVSLTVSKPAGSDTKTKTSYITVTPPIFIMSNTTVNTCTGNFYDPGGASNDYANGLDYTMVFNPGTAGSFLRFVFSSFSLESETTCNYDYLKIYDGNSTAGTLIGTYCGTTSPGIITATNASGSLTFVFHSDGSVVSTGWDALISCVAGVVANPAAFSATPSSTTQIDLAWTKNASANNVMVVWASSATFGTPVNGTVYTPGSTLPGGGTVLYRGNGTTYNHTSLSPSTTYFYKAFSYNGTNEYSTGLTTDATTLCGVFTLPLNESFASSIMPTCWTTEISGTGTNSWSVANSTYAGGTPYEIKNMYQQLNPGTTRLVTPPINTIGMLMLNLSFKHMIDGYGTGTTFKIQTSQNGSTWVDESWYIAGSASNVGPETVNTTILYNVNSPTTYIAFTIDGDLYQYDYWNIDDISITGVVLNTLSVAPSNQDVTAASGSTSFAVSSNTTWNVSCDQPSWCSVTPSGSGNGTITATYNANASITPRTANITVTVAGLAPVVVTVSQAGATLSVTPSDQMVPYTAGTTTFNVTSNSAWTAVSNQPWCTVTPSGAGNGTITANYTQNALAIPHIASITVTVAGLTPVVVTVTQASAPSLTVLPANQNVTYQAGSAVFTVTSNRNWTVSSAQSWCSVPSSGTGNGIITATYSNNPTCELRVANITLTVTGIPPVVVTVSQDGEAPPTLSSTLAPAPICTNTLFSYTPTSTTPGTTFAWSRAAVPGISNPSASGVNNPEEVLINNTTLPVAVTYVYTLSANGCVNVQNVTVTVNPKPTVTVSGSTTICSGLTAVGPPPLPGEHGSGGDSGFPTLTFTFTGKAPWNLSYTDGSMVYTINGINTSPYTIGVLPFVTTVYTATALADSNCTADPGGLIGSGSVIVNPIPDINTVPNQTICGGELMNEVIFTGTGNSYAWVNSDPSIGLAASGTGNLPAFMAVNNGMVPVVTTITVTPEYVLNGVTCPGTPTSFTITVNQTSPVLSSTLKPPQICSDALFSYIPTSETPGTTFSWTRAAVPGISNPAGSGSNNPNETLVNITELPIDVTYVYMLQANGCTNYQDVVVKVNPNPTVSVSGSSTICSGMTTVGPPPLPGEHGSGGDSGFPTVTFTLTGTPPWNLSYTDGTGTFTINGIMTSPFLLGVLPVATTTYSATGLTDAYCTALPEGITGSATVTVNPIPYVNPVPDMITYGGSLTTAVVFTGSGTIYDWINSDPSIGLDASGSGNIPPFIAINAGTVPVVATITVTPKYSYNSVTCTGTPITFTITVNPAPILTVLPSNQDVAFSAGSVDFSVTSNTSWTAWSNQPWCSVTPSGTGDGTITADYMENFSAGPRIAEITVTVDGLLPVVVTVTQEGVPFKTLNLTLLLEGYFNQITGTMNQAQESTDGETTFNEFPGITVDTLSVYLANPTDPWEFVFEAHAVAVGQDGALSLMVPSSFNGSYYIAIRQRNSVETWSSIPISFAGNSISYDFSAEANRAFGNNLKKMSEGSGSYALYSGDVTSYESIQDGYIDIYDNNGIFNNSQAGLFGYVIDDLTGDAFVDIFDLVVVFNNLQGSVGMITPPNPGKKK